MGAVQHRHFRGQVWSGRNVPHRVLADNNELAKRWGGEGRRMPSHHLFVAWLQAGVFLLLVNLLQATYLSAVYGVGTELRLVQLGLNANLGLGVLVGAFSLEQWWKGMGTALARVGYAFAVAGVVLQMWFAWTFHLLGV